VLLRKAVNGPHDGRRKINAKELYNSMAAVISMKALLESGVHFGHRTNKWDPRMKPFIFTERNGIHIIDLQQTVKSLNTAYNLVRDTVANGGTVMFIGTKRQAQETIRDEAVRCGMPYVVERWMGGMITNWSTIFNRILELERLEKLRDSGEINRLTKKEGLLIERDIYRLESRLSGLRNMKKIPDLVFVIDVMREATAVHEANIKNIPVIALVDTNCDPTSVDYIIPSNDDAIRAIKLLVAKIADAVIEGKAARKEELEEQAVVEAEVQRAGSIRARLEEDANLDDSALLGESTLAKIGRPEADEDDEDEDDTDDVDVTDESDDDEE
jgi:small subunit ribosomal protein S2